MQFQHVQLQPMSWRILEYLSDKEPMKAADVAEALGLSPAQVNAAVTRTLVRHSFVIREHRLTEVLKKDYAVIHATDRGRAYVEHRKAQ